MTTSTRFFPPIFISIVTHGQKWTQTFRHITIRTRKDLPTIQTFRKLFLSVWSAFDFVCRNCGLSCGQYLYSCRCKRSIRNMQVVCRWHRAHERITDTRSNHACSKYDFKVIFAHRMVNAQLPLHASAFVCTGNSFSDEYWDRYYILPFWQYYKIDCVLHLAYRLSQAVCIRACTVGCESAPCSWQWNSHLNITRCI